MTVQPLDEEAIFHAARAMGSPELRANYLAEACGDNQALRARVEGLLKIYADEKSFAAMPSALLATLDHQPISERPGTVIGPYKLMEQIGEGGFGLVFVAEQQQPVRRKVALKVIKPGMDTRDVIARFEAERQALALMDHPNIARVFDAGATESGRPYFVMELVRGIPITEYCDQQHLTPRDRLELFVSLCHAIQHAHQKGIIHRDVKPSNVLVTEHDGRPVVKVIDFGVAKALSQQLTQHTIYTQFAQLIGTPLYMSPEQAAMSGLDIDTRSDIYSLGVLLYELLTGSTPFDRKRLQQAAADEIRRIIRDEEPPRPSTRISQSGDRLPSIAALRNTEPAGLSKLMRGDLDWIVMKCLDKERNRRYETVSGLARDVEHYLHDEPVAACPPSATYRFRKFARRNKVALATGAVVATALVLGTLISTWQAVRATRAEALAEQRLGAETQARKDAEAVTEFLVSAFKSPDPARDGRTVTVAEVLTQAEKRLEEDLSEQPLTRAALLSAIASSRAGLGLYEDMIAPLTKAKELREKELGINDRATLESMLGLAWAYSHVNRLDESIRLLEHTLAVAREKLGPDDDLTLSIMNELATTFQSVGRLDEAIAINEQVLAVRRTRLGLEHPHTLNSMQWLGYLYQVDYRYDESIRLLEQALAGRKKKLGLSHPETLNTMNALALSYHFSGRVDDSIQLFEQSVAAQREKLGSEHPHTLVSMRNLAGAYSTGGRFNESITLAKEIVATDHATLGADDSQTRFDSGKLALRYRDAGRYEEAIPIYRDIVDGFGTDVGASLPTMFELAVTYRLAGRQDEADRLVEDAAAKCLEHGQYANAFRLARAGNAELMDSILKNLIAQNHEKAAGGTDLIVLGELRLVAGESAAATVAIRAAIARNTRRFFMYKTLGWALLAQGQTEAAKEAFEHVLEPLRKEDGTYNLARADADRMTCAYFLDLVTEEEYVDHLKSHKSLVCYPWFYVGQRKEIEGHREAAIAAYQRCIELGQDEKTAHPVRWLAQWRLGMLGNKPD